MDQADGVGSDVAVVGSGSCHVNVSEGGGNSILGKGNVTRRMLREPAVIPSAYGGSGGR